MDLADLSVAPRPAKRIRWGSSSSRFAGADSTDKVSLDQLPTLAWNRILLHSSGFVLKSLSMTCRRLNQLVKSSIIKLRVVATEEFRKRVQSGIAEPFQDHFEQTIQRHGENLQKLTVVLANSENSLLCANGVAETISISFPNLVFLEARYERESLISALFGSTYMKCDDLLGFTVEEFLKMPKLFVFRAKLLIGSLNKFLDTFERIGEMQEIGCLDLDAFGFEVGCLTNFGFSPMTCVKNVTKWCESQQFLNLFPSAIPIFGKFSGFQRNNLILSSPDQLTKLSMHVVAVCREDDEVYDQLALLGNLREFNVTNVYGGSRLSTFANFDFFREYKHLECLRLGDNVVGEKIYDLFRELPASAPLRHICVDDNSFEGSYDKLIVEALRRDYPLKEVYLRGECSLPALIELFAKRADTLESLRVNLADADSSSVLARIPDTLIRRLRNLCLHGTWKLSSEAIEQFLARRRLAFLDGGSPCSFLNLWVPLENWSAEQESALKESAWGAGVQIVSTDDAAMKSP